MTYNLCWTKPYRLDTPGKVAWANEEAPHGGAWKLHDDCPFRPVIEDNAEESGTLGESIALGVEQDVVERGRMRE